METHVIYDWIRHWEPLSPETSGEQVADTQLVTTADLPELPCIVLLGPPGSGKTTELAAAQNNAIKRGHRTQVISLRYITSPESLQNELESLLEAEEPAPNLFTHVFLDGFDEFPARIDHARGWLMGWLKSRGADAVKNRSLRLRITCRSADWPNGFEAELATVFGAGNVVVYQLTPLSVHDVEVAFKAQNPSHWDRFNAALTRGGLWPLATQPVTLPMLVRAFKANEGNLPTSLVDLYRTALLAMVEGWRQGNTSLDGSSSPQKLLLVGRIAAASVLTNKSQIWTGLYSEQAPSGAMSISDLVGDSETYQGNSFAADERALRGVLHTAVFRSSGVQLFTWEHLTFAEYLTALYLHSRNLPADHLLTFIAKPDGGQTRIAPQLREVAGWLAGMSPQFRTLLITSEPDLLLRSDIAGADNPFKEALTVELLSRLDREEMFDWWRDQRLDYGRLKCPGLAKHLRPYVSESGHNDMARRAAIQIAGICKVTELAQDLLNFAEKDSASADLRALAVMTYGTLSTEGIDRLLPLLQMSPASDPHDEIKGAALQALWPQHLDQADLFPALTNPQHPYRYGTYRHFLHGLSFDSLTPAASIAALNWLRILSPDTTRAYDLRGLAQPVLLAAWRNLGDSAVEAAFATLIADFIRATNLSLRSVDISDFVKEYLAVRPEVRQALIFKVTAQLGSPRRYDLRMGPWQLTCFSDLPWLLKDLVSEHPHMPEETAIETIVHFANIHAYDHGVNTLEFVWAYCQRSEKLSKALEATFSVPLDSSLAHWLKQDFENKNKPKPEPPPNPNALRREAIDKWIDDCNKDSAKWWVLNLLLLQDDGERGFSELSASLADSPGWLRASEEQRAAMLHIASQYLEKEQRPDDADWLGSNTVWRNAAAGYRSLRLLYTERPDDFAALSTAAWQNWGATALWFPSSETEEDKQLRFAVVTEFRKRAPQAFKASLQFLLSRPDANYDTAEMVSGFYDEDIADNLWAALQQNHLNKFAAHKLAELLLDNDFQPIVKAARKWLTIADKAGPIPIEDDSPAVFIPALYFSHATASSWPLFYARREWDPDHVRAIWFWVANHSFTEMPYLEALTPEQIGDLYIWLTDDFPRPEPSPTGFIGAIEQLDRVRSVAINALVAAGNDEAVETLKRLVLKYPDQQFLKVHLQSTQDARRAATWVWPTLQDMFARLGIIRTRNFADAVLAQSAIDEKLEESAFATSVSTFNIELSVSTTVELEEVRPTFIFLLVATEWQSKHGGLSTFNRDMCISLARNGQKVFCLLPEVDPGDLADAKAKDVTLVPAGEQLGFSDLELLTALAAAPIDVKPNVIVGHDHITGRQAFRIKNLFYPKAKVVHILHTTPDIEAHKDGHSHVEAAMRGGAKEEDQRLLCENADLVLAVGPRIRGYACNSNPLHTRKIIEFLPGLDEEFLKIAPSIDARRQKQILWLGRGDQPGLKGLEIALNVISILDKKALTSPPRPRLVVRGLDLNDKESPAISMCTEFQDQHVKFSAIEMRKFESDRAAIQRDLLGATCMIMPSQVEPFGLVALEAIALGTPVFVGSESGIGQLLLDMKRRSSGSFTTPDGVVLNIDKDILKTAEQWANAISACLDDEDVAFAKAEDMRKSLTPFVSWNRSTTQLLVHIKAMLLGPTTTGSL
jgi:glycosyltransferase involved in cell wall biosynthesis